jgi:catechol 2,3-dioxygenase-like lactoylglutathione lyase family enzyme
MGISLVSHVSLRSAELREAEEYYSQLFNLRVAFRETETSDGWRRLPNNKSWADADLAGVEIEMVMLHREGFALGLEKASSVEALGNLSHVGLLVDQGELHRFRSLISKLDCCVVHDFDEAVVFDDKFGVRWEPSLLEYSNPSQIGDRPERYLVL